MNGEWKKWCRLCAGSQDVSVPLCVTDDYDDECSASFGVVEKANKYLNLNISVHTSCYPQWVCNTCVNFLHQIDSFAAQCARVQDMFYKLIVELENEKNSTNVEGGEDEVGEDVRNLESVSELRSCRIPGKCLEKNYETVPVEPYENETKRKVRGRGISKRKGKPPLLTRSRGCGRSRKCDKIVPRIKIRAVQPPSVDDQKVTQDSEVNGISACNLLKGDQRKLVGAAKRKTKIRQNLFSGIKTVTSNENGENLVPDIGSDVKVEEVTTNDDSTAHKKLRKTELKSLVPYLYNFKCHLCEYSFKNWSSLRTHCKEAHPGEKAQITCHCGKVLSTRTAIVEHRARHTDASLYKCDKCEKTFYRKSLLNIHVMSHVPKEEQPFVCCKCARRFHCEALLRNHERVHLPKEERLVFQCHVCQKMFSSKSAVSAHLKAIHFGERPFVCDQCGHCFSSKGILQEHLTIHSDEAPWNCSKCNKNFKTKYRLKIHMDTHRETPYQCPKCPVQLSTRRTLRMHLVVHRDVKAYQCPTCGKEFRRAKDLKNHSNLHTGRRPYTCPFCSRTFANGSNCRSHKRRMHPEELQMFESSLSEQPTESSSNANVSINDNNQRNSNESHLTASNGNITVFNDKKINRLSILNPSCENIPEVQANEERKNTSPAMVNNYPSSFLSFVDASDQKYLSVKQSSSLLRPSFNENFSTLHVNHNYSPSHDEDISTSAVPAFPGNPYIHHQSFLFNRSVEPS